MQKKVWTKMCMLALLCVSTSLFAAEKDSVKPNGCKGPVLCPSYPIYEGCKDCCFKWHVDIGLLYQQPWIQYMQAGYVSYGEPYFQNHTKTHDASRFNRDNYDNARYENYEMCYNYTPGITASLGYFTDHDHWYVGARFDWLSSQYAPGMISKKNACYYMPPCAKSIIY